MPEDKQVVYIERAQQTASLERSLSQAYANSPDETVRNACRVMANGAADVVELQIQAALDGPKAQEISDYGVDNPVSL